MNLYDVWIDGLQGFHPIEKMDTNYILYCVEEIYKAASNWRLDTFDDLTAADLKQFNKPLDRAWFVLNARGYLYRFRNELIARCESTESVDNAIAFSNQKDI